MERKIRYVWWGLLVLLFAAALWQFVLPHRSKVTIEKTSSNREIVVYVSGAVEKPGLVHLPVDARLNDALKQANLLAEANVDQMNPAEKLKDGQKITVPYKTTGQASEAQNSSNLNANTPNSNPGPGVQSGAGASTGRININTAGASELDKLPGIGPALAERIIQYRNEHGAFSTPEDLQKVAGIGSKTYEKMSSMLTVGP